MCSRSASDAAENELAAHVGLRAGRIRLAAFPSALSTLVPIAAARLERARLELAAEPEFDAVVVNESVQQACDELVKLLHLRP